MADFELIHVTPQGVKIFSGLSTDTYPPNPEVTDQAWETDGLGLKKEYRGAAAGWVEIGVQSSGNSANVMDAFKPSIYTGKISSSEAGTAFALGTGARRILLQSLEVTGLEEYAIIAFGTSAADAQANLAKTGTTPNIIANAGIVIFSGDSTAGGGAPYLPPIGIPKSSWGENGGYAAIGNGVAGLVQVIMVTQGV